MSTTMYEITVELPNGDWAWTQRELADMHEVLIHALDFAHVRGGRVHHIERLTPIPLLAHDAAHRDAAVRKAAAELLLRGQVSRDGVIERVK